MQTTKTGYTDMEMDNADRRGRLMLDMWDGRWTLNKLSNFGWDSNAMCNSYVQQKGKNT
jgi:hypothetical protein